MLFRKDIDPMCAYCKRGSRMNRQNVVCTKKGVVSATYHCRSFSYDPFKREPSRPIALETSRLKEEDFRL